MPTDTWWNLPEGKQRRVLDAATREFGDHGFSAGSLNVVAREAGVAKGSLFQYFADKRELYAFVVDVVSQRIRDDFLVVLSRRAVEHEDFFDFLRATLVDWVEYFEEHPLERGITFAANFEHDPEARQAVRHVTNGHYLEVLEALVDEADRRGQLRPDASRPHLLSLLIVLLPHLAMARTSPELDPVLDLHRAHGHGLQAAVGGYVDVLESAFAAQRVPLGKHR